MQTKKNIVSPIPFAIVGVALGLTTLGTGWTLFANQGGGFSFEANWVPKLTMTLACLFVLLGIIKMLGDPKWTWNHLLKDAIASSHFAVFPMVIISIGAFILGYQDKSATGTYLHSGGVYYFGLIVWYLGLIIQLSHFLFWFILKCWTFKWADVDASWYVPPVGIAAANVIPAQQLGDHYTLFLQVLWYIVFAMYIIATPIIWYRYLFIKGHDSELPSMGILTSVHSLMLVSYFFDFNDTPQEHPSFMIILGSFSLVMTLIIYITMFKTFRTKWFNPGLSGYSFPLAVSAVGRIIFGEYLAKLVTNPTMQNELLTTFKYWALIELIIATGVFIYLIAGFSYLLVTDYMNYFKNNKQATKAKA
ncbi:hypothetical protein [Spiroplasma eriocheiris]|uniref:Uncharacterized protein n=1 Tax=Spiroplasma eriocheiris TaxID=315358 RepID=A0A0H3XLF5_9MOLU|nr:hypothetical protein [Spiroplasma eriocheiris]AHF58331.1 putative C4-dicarboxylate transporter/malic acid transport protein [Spiroplasma eriocheiris CCTCC M 207170]AKM54766.1 hypothetical protein SERIO_v1c12170 [Spiroplasma eriocheiris]